MIISYIAWLRYHDGAWLSYDKHDSACQEDILSVYIKIILYKSIVL